MTSEMIFNLGLQSLIVLVIIEQIVTLGFVICYLRTRERVCLWNAIVGACACAFGSLAIFINMRG